MEKKAYTHVLQKTGILKNFTVAKIVQKKEIDDLKKLIRSVAGSDEEYKKIFEEEMRKISNMHDEKNPIPGIIYAPSEDERKKMIYSITKKFCQAARNQDFSKRDLAFLVTAIINELGLTQEDFNKLRDESTKGDEEDDGDDYSPPKF